jgi:hypothetical protein
MLLDSIAIQKILPHRYPFLLVDAIEEMEPKKRIVGIKNVTINEYFCCCCWMWRIATASCCIWRELTLRAFVAP